ncbi:unnamed protein product [Miscanthus lutarioriparius]|uniref:Uncharacterized protein n=1 Tax=Miscanthus lutarioriparius TaxID=422564 RepID=A0A811NFG5_9POAL|nr:unnamed protein product [Miscanthus lutarioriparius]
MSPLLLSSILPVIKDGKSGSNTPDKHSGCTVLNQCIIKHQSARSTTFICSGMSAGLLALPNCRITGSWLDDDDGPEACVCVCAGGVGACGGAEEAWRLVAQNQRPLLLLVAVASLQSPSTKLGEPAAAQVHGAVPSWPEAPADTAPCDCSSAASRACSGPFLARPREQAPCAPPALAPAALEQPNRPPGAGMGGGGSAGRSRWGPAEGRAGQGSGGGRRQGRRGERWSRRQRGARGAGQGRRPTGESREWWDRGSSLRAWGVGGVGVGSGRWGSRASPRMG